MNKPGSYLFPIMLSSLVLSIILYFGFVHHPDGLLFETRGDILEQKDFNPALGGFEIKQTNTGDYVLVYASGVLKGIFVEDKAGDNVQSSDINYVKYRAWRFWQNQVRSSD